MASILQKIRGENPFQIYDDIALNCFRIIISSKRDTTMEKLPDAVYEPKQEAHFLLTGTV